MTTWECGRRGARGFCRGGSTGGAAGASFAAMEASECLPPELAKFWRTDDGLTAVERAEAYGIDLSLLEDNLRLTPGERLRRNDAALALIFALRSAREHGGA